MTNPIPALLAGSLASLACATATAGEFRVPPGLVAPTLGVGDSGFGFAINKTNTPGDEAAKFIIRRPGAYYLESNLLGEAGKSGVDIAAAHVTLDLRGFELAGVSGATVGIRVRGAQSNIVIRNGALHGWPGIGLDATEAPFSTFEDLRAVENGTGLLVSTRTVVRRCSAISNNGGGILTGQSAIVEDCTSSYNKGLGVYVLESSLIQGCILEGNAEHGIYLDGGAGQVRDCIAIHNGLNGIASIYGGTIRNSTAEQNGGDGLWSIAPVTFESCVAAFNAGDGIEAADGSTVTQCVVRENGQNGLRLGQRVAASRNYAEKHLGGAGIRAAGAFARIEDNTLAGNQVGVVVEATGCLIVRNRASGSTSQAFEIAPGNAYGPIVDVAGGGDLSLIAGAEHPLANLVH